MYLSSRMHPVPGQREPFPSGGKGQVMAASNAVQPQPLPSGQPAAQQAVGLPCTAQRCISVGPDFGPEPLVVNIDEATLQNPYFRRTLWTGAHLQMTLMCIPPNGEIGLEMHDYLDQFLRLEQGQGRVMMGAAQNNLGYRQDVGADSAIFIPAGTWHNLVNTGGLPIKLYSIYAPVQHPAGTIHCTKADSDQAEGHSRD